MFVIGGFVVVVIDLFKFKGVKSIKLVNLVVVLEGIVEV